MTLSFVLAMLQVSFRSLPSASFPGLRGGKPALAGLAAAVIVLAGCGSGGHKATSSNGRLSSSPAAASTSSCAASRRAPTTAPAGRCSARSGRGSRLLLGGGCAAGPTLPRAVEGGREHAVERVGENELDRVARLRRELLQVGLVLARQHDTLDPGPLRGEHLLAHAADR